MVAQWDGPGDGPGGAGGTILARLWPLWAPGPLPMGPEGLWDPFGPGMGPNEWFWVHLEPF